MTLALHGCIDKTHISVQVSPDTIFVENQRVDKHDFEKALRLVIEQKISAGIAQEEITIDMKVDGATKRGDIADIEMCLRRLNVRKITYSDL